MKKTLVVLSLLFLACIPLKSEDIYWDMPNMDEMMCYQSQTDERVVSCSVDGIVPTDPNMFLIARDAAYSFFPTIDIPHDTMFVIVHLPFKKFEKRAAKRFGKIAQQQGYYLNAHTYVDRESGVIVIECSTQINIMTVTHELLHHLLPQVISVEIITHEMLDVMAAHIISHNNTKQTLSQNYD